MTTDEPVADTNQQDNHHGIDALVARWHALVNDAQHLDETGMKDKVLDLHQQGLALASELSWPEAELYNLRKISDLLQQPEQSDECVHYLRMGIAKADEVEDFEAKAWLSYQLAEILWSLDKSEAFYWYELALESAPYPEDWSIITLYYLTLGLHLRGEHHDAKAAALYQEAADRAAHVSDISEGLSFRLKAAWAFVAMSQWEMAVEQLQTALALAGIDAYPKKRRELLEELGDVHILSGDLIQAKNAFEEAITLSKHLSDEESQIRQLLKLGTTYRFLGNPAEAESVILTALKLARNQQALQQVVESLCDLSKTKLLLGEQETAVIPLQEAFTIAHSLDEPDLELDILAQLAAAYDQIGLTTVAAETAVTGLETAFVHDNATGVLNFLSILGSIGNFPHPFWTTIDKVVAIALDRSRQSDYPLALSECLAAVGNLYIEQDAKRALGYYQEMANLFLEEGNTSRYVTACGLVASAYQYLNDWEQAVHTLKTGLQQIKKQESSYLIQEIDFLLHLAYLYWKSGNVAECEKCLMAITQKESYGQLDIDRAFHISEQKGDLYFVQGRYPQAEQAYQTALNMLDQQFYGAVTSNARLKIRKTGRFLYGRLILASYWQHNAPTANRQQTFHYVETSRSRLFLSQLGQTAIRHPHLLPEHLLLQEQVLLAKLHVLRQQAFAETAGLHLEEQANLWQNLQQLWQKMAAMGVEAGDYVAQRRGSAITYPELQVCLSNFE